MHAHRRPEGWTQAHCGEGKDMQPSLPHRVTQTSGQGNLCARETFQGWEELAGRWGLFLAEQMAQQGPCQLEAEPGCVLSGAPGEGVCSTAPLGLSPLAQAQCSSDLPGALLTPVAPVFQGSGLVPG